MLNANSGSLHEVEDLSAVLGDASTVWGDARKAGPSSHPDSNPDGREGSSIHFQNGAAVQNGSASSTALGRAGLRSRKASVHRRTSSLTPASHPLQPPSPPKSRTASKGGTRRSLSRRRQISESNLFDHSDSDGSLDDGFERETVREAEIMVIVHEIMSSDSIAGVALKYGIALADLRKANRLLASDSIHLRKELYIPLHLSDRKHAFFNGEHDSDEAQASSSSEPSITIKRIPASKLAFFPPPTSASFPSTPPSFASASTPDASYSSASLDFGVNSFLRSLPMPSKDSLAHTFLARLSLDSSEASSAYGTPTGAASLSETSSEVDAHEVELEMEVLSSGEVREFEELGIDTDEPRTPKLNGNGHRQRTRGRERAPATTGGRSFGSPQAKAGVTNTFELCMPGQAASALGGYAALGMGMAPRGKGTAIVSSQPQPHAHQMRASPQMQLPRAN